MKRLLFLFLCIGFNVLAQQGGMWIPSLLEGMNETEIKSLGGNLTAKDIYDVNSSSLKDAIVHFNGGCTAEVISPKGLLLTNHHCGFSQIQSHSTLENDYIKDGFWTKKFSEELPNSGLYVDFIVRIEDVTDAVLEGVTEAMTEKEKQAKINSNSNTVEKNAHKEDWQQTKIKAFYKGNQYFLFVYERFEDIRLVGAPPASIGKFGSDTDNWVWPRHTGDFSLFRIYASPDNKPAKYSFNNVPYKPKHFLPVSLNGIKEGDFTLVFGFPGRTQEYLPAVAVEQITKKINPGNIAIREAALKVIDQAMKKDDKTRIQYASKQARIANYWKKWIGENQGLERVKAIQKKKAFEKQFSEKIIKQGLETTYGNILPQVEILYKKIEPIAVKRSNFMEVFIRNNELMQLMFRMYQLESSITKDVNSFDRAKSFVLAKAKKLFKDYNATVDKAIFKAIMPLYTKTYDATIYDNTQFTSYENTVKTLEGTPQEVLKNLQNDVAYKFAKPYFNKFYSEINPRYFALNDEINALQKKYIKAQMQVMPNERYFPDANSTLRVTYGQVKGYAPKDGVYYNPVTYLDGVIEKYIPGDYEFDVPQRLQELYAQKDYGQYADDNGKLPVCFLGTNHTTGGNSGSPALDANGNLIGLNFDRVWEGTMSDIYYDPEICRNIMVDIRYVLFIIDKYAGAQRLIKEMQLVK